MAAVIEEASQLKSLEDGALWTEPRSATSSPTMSRRSSVISKLSGGPAPAIKLKLALAENTRMKSHVADLERENETLTASLSRNEQYIEMLQRKIKHFESKMSEKKDDTFDQEESNRSLLSSKSFDEFKRGESLYYPMKMYGTVYQNALKDLNTFPSEADLDKQENELLDRIANILPNITKAEETLRTLKDEIIRVQHKLRFGSGTSKFSELKILEAKEIQKIRELRSTREKDEKKLDEVYDLKNRRAKSQLNFNQILQEIFHSVPPIPQDVERMNRYQVCYTLFSEIQNELLSANSALQFLRQSLAYRKKSASNLAAILQVMTKEPANCPVDIQSVPYTDYQRHIHRAVQGVDSAVETIKKHRIETNSHVPAFSVLISQIGHLNHKIWPSLLPVDALSVVKRKVLSSYSSLSSDMDKFEKIIERFEQHVQNVRAAFQLRKGDVLRELDNVNSNRMVLIERVLGFAKNQPDAKSFYSFDRSTMSSGHTMSSANTMVGENEYQEYGPDVINPLIHSLKDSLTLSPASDATTLPGTPLLKRNVSQLRRMPSLVSSDDEDDIESRLSSVMEGDDGVVETPKLGNFLVDKENFLQRKDSPPFRNYRGSVGLPAATVSMSRLAKSHSGSTPNLQALRSPSGKGSVSPPPEREEGKVYAVQRTWSPVYVQEKDTANEMNELLNETQQLLTRIKDKIPQSPETKDLQHMISQERFHKVQLQTSPSQQNLKTAKMRNRSASTPEKPVDL
ncbi:hypothetical protein HK098_005198 [Nowakowskiella sp. JEL0407]|nr:hypothetical protein HK098_005198 [Nowakowskiella sp. JEL0407]